MEVEFRDKKLHRCSEDESFGRKKLGEERYRKYMQRIGDLLAADSLEDVRNIPGRYHELIGDRKRQWACDLDHPYRLIFTAHERPIPTDKAGKYVWIEITAVDIIEIDNYHGK